MKDIIIILENACPMSCKYCFFNNEVTYFNEEKVFESLSKIVKKDEAFACTFFPDCFSNPELTEKIGNKILEEYNKAKIYLITGGLNLKKLNFINQDKTEIHVSIDGDEYSQNYFRGSFDEVVANIKEYKSFYNMQQGNITLNPETIDHLFSSVKFLWDELSFSKISVGFNQSAIWTPESFKIMEQQYEMIYNDYIANDRYNKGQTTHLLEFAPLKEYDGNSGGCSLYTGGYINAIIRRNGELAPCFMMLDKTFEEVKKYTYDYMLDDECKSCKLLSGCRTCAGIAEKKVKSICDYTKLRYKYTQKLRQHLNLSLENETKYIKITENEIAQYKVISNKIKCVTETINKNTEDKFITGLLNVKHEYQKTLDSWWTQIKTKYNISTDIDYKYNEKLRHIDVDGSCIR